MTDEIHTGALEEAPTEESEMDSPDETDLDAERKGDDDGEA